MAKKSTIKLPVQALNWGAIKNPSRLWKIFFQFDVQASGDGHKFFRLVAYPAYKSRGKCTIGKKIPLTVKRWKKFQELPLPLTLGNLELKYQDIKNKFALHGKKQLELTPFLHASNPHAGYTVSDGSSALNANPSPPAPPAS